MALDRCDVLVSIYTAFDAARVKAPIFYSAVITFAEVTTPIFASVYCKASTSFSLLCTLVKSNAACSAALASAFSRVVFHSCRLAAAILQIRESLIVSDDRWQVFIVL